MNFILYIIFLGRRNADNGLSWIKPVQNFTISMITDLHQRAKWTQKRRHLEECVALLRYSRSSRFILFSLSVLRSDEVTKGPLPRYLCLCFKRVRPRAKPFIWKRACRGKHSHMNGFARRLVRGKRLLDNGLSRKVSDLQTSLRREVEDRL